MKFGRFQWLLYGLVAIIVLVPSWFIREANRKIQDADQALAHASHVNATTSRLLFEMRDLDAAAANFAAGIDVPDLRRRVVETTDAIPVLLNRLIELSRDNPAQQVRLGELKSRMEQRMQSNLRIIESADRQERVRLLRLMIEEFRLRDAALEVQKEEAFQLEKRTRIADELRRQGEWLTLAAVGSQLALLSLLVWLVLRHQRARDLAESAANAANARALAVMQSVREPIALIDRELRVIMHNPAFDELYGSADGNQRIDGEHIGRIGEGNWAGREVSQRLRDVVGRGRELWDFEVEQVTADGVKRTMLLNARRMSLPGREDEVALVTLGDISGQKAFEREISELNQQLQGKVQQVSDINRELEAFSYSVSHDLRAPLRHISGFAGKLERHLGNDADEKTRHYIGTIETSAKRMAMLIDDLLVYSRLGRSALRLQPVDMQSLVAEVRAMLDANAAIDTPGRRIEWIIDPLPIVIADENMMRQVWLNLLGNAVKYSAPSDPSRIRVGYERLPDGLYAFSVTDNGVGFDMAYAGKLFGVFQRMHKASEFPGTGIGLASVQRVLSRHGGQVSAESAVGKGSTFRFILPSVLDDAAGPRQPKPSKETPPP